MCPDRVVSALTPRTQFILGIAVFVGVSLAAIPYIGFVYGWREAGGSALILSLPVFIAIRLYCRWQGVQEQEIAFLMVVAIFAAVGVCALMGSWNSAGALEWEAARMNRQLHRDPAFRNVEASARPKASLHLSGTVASADDMARLKSLVAQSHSQWSMHVEVAEEEAKHPN